MLSHPDCRQVDAASVPRRLGVTPFRVLLSAYVLSLRCFIGQDDIVSGHRGPQLPDHDPPIHDLPDDEFIEELTILNGTPAEVFESPELVELMLPLWHADFTAAETYQYTGEQPLECPITAFGDDSDLLARVSKIEGWRVQTAAAFAPHILDDDHFFFRQSRRQFLRILNKVLGAVLSELPAYGGRF